MWHIVNVNILRIMVNKSCNPSSNSCGCIWISCLNYGPPQSTSFQYNPVQYFASTEQKLPKICTCDNNSNTNINQSVYSYLQLKPSASPLSLSFDLNKKETTNNLFIASSIIRQAVSNFFVFVEEISHMDEVRKAQYKAIDIKDSLKESGDKKREILFELNAIRTEIQKNHTEICNAMRGTERYVSLVREEMALLNNEQKKQTEFTQADELERQLFTQMTNAINDSYEKEKVHSNFIKVLGLIGTLTASIVTLIASAIGHYYHNTKFGLVANDFKENVNATIQSEIKSLKDCLRLDIVTAMSRQEELLKNLNHKKKSEVAAVIPKESWTAFLTRLLNFSRLYSSKTSSVN